MSPAFRTLCVTALASVSMLAQSTQPKPLSDKSVLMNQLAPKVMSPYSVVDQMLDLAELKRGETLYDLGCGDGRILVVAAQKYGAKAVGVELLPSMVGKARENIEKNRVQDLASVIEGDAMDVDLSPANVVTLYLTTEFNDALRPRLEKYLRPGTRVVSFDYPVPHWKPQRKEMADVFNHKHPIYVYTVPRRK